MTNAQAEARGLKHPHIGTDHLVLGLLSQEGTTACEALTNLGVTLEGARAAVIESLPPGGKDVNGQIPFTERANEVLEGTVREALSLGNNYVATEHILLALTRQRYYLPRGLPDLTPEKIRNEVLRVRQEKAWPSEKAHAERGAEKAGSAKVLREGYSWWEMPYRDPERWARLKLIGAGLVSVAEEAIELASRARTLAREENMAPPRDDD